MPQQVVKGVLKGTLFSVVQTRNVFYYGANADQPTNDTRDQVFQRLSDIADAFATLGSPAVNFYESEVFRFATPEWLPMGVASLNVTGEQDDSDITSYQTAGLITATTSVLKAIGRKFIPGIAETRTIDSAMVLAAAQDMAICLVEYLTTFQSQNQVWYPGIPSKNSEFAPFIGASFASLLSTMRRRKPGYGI